jgi:hypothetical protein
MMLGHAAGTAGAISAASGAAVQDVEMKTLQDRLKKEKQVIDFA